MTPSGWYNDPANPGTERFWDGTQWTEHTRTPPFAPPPPPPFSQGNRGAYPAGSGTTRYPGGKLNQIGDWLNRSFAAPLEQVGPLTIFFLVPFAAFAVAYLIGHLSMRNAVIGDGGIDGVNVGLVVAAVLAMVAAAVVSSGAYLATHHHLYGAVIGSPPEWSRSLSVGFKRLPIFIGVMLALSAALVIPIGLAVALVVATEAFVLLLVLVPVLIVFAVWAVVKLSLIAVSIAVAPEGTSGLSAGWHSTDGFFWAILGRLFLMGIVVNVLLFIQQMLAGELWPLAFGSQLEFDSRGELLIDGRPASTLDALVVADVLPNPIVFLLVSGVLFYIQFMMQTVSFAGSSALYADTGAANSFGHR
jgi:hypothetical protein